MRYPNNDAKQNKNDLTTIFFKDLDNSVCETRSSIAPSRSIKTAISAGRQSLQNPRSRNLGIVRG